MLQFALRLALFLLSSLGCWEALRRRQLPLYFLPALTIALQFLVLFFAGLWNLLPQAAWGLYLGGLYLFFHFFRQEKLAFPKRYLNCGYGLFILGLLFCALALRGQIASWYDDFTHWTRVVRTMLETQHFPNFTDLDISHQSYPLGSSAWIYYFSMYVGNSEAIWMLGQCYILLAMLLPLFSLTPNRPLLAAPLVVLLTNSLLCYNVPIHSLLVDSLLSIVSMAALLMIYQYFFRKDAPRSFDPVWTAPLLCLTFQIKNSGALFAALGLVMLLWLAFQDQKLRSRYLLALLIPLAILLLWNRHSDYVFPRALEGFHALSTENFATTISQKTLGDIRFIITIDVEYIFTRREFFWLLGCSVAMAIVLVFARNTKSAIQFLSCAAGLYLLYAVGLICMYLFSMSLGEARTMACIDRYMKTIDIAIYVLIGACALSVLSQLRTAKKAIALSGIFLLLAMVGWQQYYGRFVTIVDAPNASRRLELQALVEEYGIPQGESYFLCIPEDDNSYTWIMARYHLDTRTIAAEVINSPKKLQAASEYAIFINLDPGNPLIQDYLAKNYPEHQDEQVVFDFT